MTHYQAILEHIQADAPCSYINVINWAKSQGFGGGRMVFAIQTMIREGAISVINEGGCAIIELN